MKYGVFMKTKIVIFNLFFLGLQFVQAQTSVDLMLYKSIKDNNMRLFSEAIKRKPDLNTVYPYANFEIITSNFIKAIELNRYEMVRQMILMGADVNQVRYSDGITASMLAAKKNHSTILVLLMQAGADINQTTYLNRTALQIAALYNSVEAGKVLVSHPQMNVNNRDELCALAVAARENHIEFVSLLLSLKGTQSPTSRCLRGAREAARTKGNIEIFKLLTRA